MFDEKKAVLEDGSRLEPGWDQHNAKTGKAPVYAVLPEAERVQDQRVKPTRTMITHVGRPVVSGKFRDLTQAEQIKYAGVTPPFVKHEEYPPRHEPPKSGRFWTQEALDAVGQCGNHIELPAALAETLAVDEDWPLHQGIYCPHCKKTCAPEEFVWEGTDERVWRGVKFR